ncbi:MAG: hypothetical protein BWY56_01095 [Acidobacteria bacterium ADurb.Bin340]|nr:MAG: hypothetical protein BWY56_01095 [Acidobacteria bacterium ADurb.Bin340]
MNLPAFTHPWILLPAGGLALLALLAGLWAQTRMGQGVRVVGQRPWRLGLGSALMLAGLGVGLAEPRFGLPEFPRLTVQVVLDASRSMNARDLPEGTSRWKGATAILDRLWNEAPGGISFGVDLLTGDTIPLVPPGEDRALLREALRAVEPGTFGSPGTSLGRGLPQVAGQVDRATPAVLLLLADGEETWEAKPEALARATTFLKEARLPLYIVCLGGTAPVALPTAEGEGTLTTAADPVFLKQLAEGTGGRLLEPHEDLAGLFQELAKGHLPLPVSRSHQPAHPEWGAWLALAGLAIWLWGAGSPLRTWRVGLGLAFALGAPAQAEIPLPASVRAWLAQRALDQNDLPSARRWSPQGGQPDHRLLAALIQLKAQNPEGALEVLRPLTGQGVPRPVPAWRAPALLLAARAHRDLDRTPEAIALLERLLKEEPGRSEAVHNLQTLLKDAPPPPETPPPPPPPRPSMGAQQDELEGRKQKLPQKQKPPAGVKDL